jgi:hypothetical protein
MVWSLDYYPLSMQNLDAPIRNKAIEIANALLEESYEEGRAIPIAIEQAQIGANTFDSCSQDWLLHIVPHPQGWAIRWATSHRACFVFSTLNEAQNMALEISHNEYVGIIIHDADGYIQNEITPYPLQ